MNDANVKLNNKGKHWTKYVEESPVFSLIILVFITLFFRPIFGILMAPIIYLIHKKPSQTLIYLAGIYAFLLTVLNVAVYLSGNLNSEGKFDGSLLIVLVFIILFINILKTLKKARTLIKKD